MSKFTTYANQGNTIAKDAFAKYSAAEKAYENAMKMVRKYPQRHGAVDDEYAAQSARAYADKVEAENKLKAARREMEEAKKGLAEVRRQLSAEVNEYFGADPEAVDCGTMELLRSGILKPSEYVSLANKAQKNRNFTMARMIASYAGEAAEAAHKRGNEDDASTLMGAVAIGKQDGGKQVMEAFDAITTIYSMTCENPGMAGKWDELTGPLIATI